MSKTVEDVLAHWGIKGQKWGVRRKNPSGSKVSSDEHKETAGIKKKKAHELSNKELETAIKRIRLEQDYKSLTAKQKNKALEYVKDLLLTQAKEATKAQMSKMVKAAMEDKK